MSPSEQRYRGMAHRPEIELAWRRAKLSGLDPGMEVRETTVADVEKRTSLSIAAGPVLDHMVDELADTRFSVLLADRSSRIIDRRVIDRAMGRELDRVLAVPGFQYLEELSGTNSLATAFELRRPIAVTGGEHFLEALRQFCCYGAPIIHPVTHRLEGVIDVSGPVGDATALLGPFLTRAARDIEQRLLEGARVAEKELLLQFQANGSHRHAVVVLGESMVLANPLAADLVKGDDYVALRAIAADLSNHSVYECALTLNSGKEVTVRAKLVAGTRGGAIFEIVIAAVGSVPRSRIVRSQIGQEGSGEKEPRDAALIAVTGESGTGRTTLATKIAGFERKHFDACDALDDPDKWIIDVRTALRTSTPVVLDNVDALDHRLAKLLANTLQDIAGQVVLVSAPLASIFRDVCC